MIKQRKFKVLTCKKCENIMRVFRYSNTRSEITSKRTNENDITQFRDVIFITQFYKTQNNLT